MRNKVRTGVVLSAFIEETQNFIELLEANLISLLRASIECIGRTSAASSDRLLYKCSGEQVEFGAGR